MPTTCGNFLLFRWKFNLSSAIADPWTLRTTSRNCDEERTAPWPLLEMSQAIVAHLGGVGGFLRGWILLSHWSQIRFKDFKNVFLLQIPFCLLPFIRIFLGIVAKFVNMYHVQIKQENTLDTQIFLDLLWGSIPVNP